MSPAMIHVSGNCPAIDFRFWIAFHSICELALHQDFSGCNQVL
jgi:hypothetical protein